MRPDEELAAIRVSGTIVPHDGTIALCPYDDAWPGLYAAEARKIRDALGEGARVLEHVGSTSIPGMPAKAILDILVAVDDAADEPAYVPALVAQGYRLHLREPDWHEHRLLKGDAPVVNMHVCGLGGFGPVLARLSHCDSGDWRRVIVVAHSTIRTMTLPLARPDSR